MSSGERVGTHSGSIQVLKAQRSPSLEDLYLAYRKAKIDVFYERSQPMAVQFCDFEKNLHENLSKLRDQLRNPKQAWSRNLSFIGSVRYIPKSLTLPKNDNGSIHFSQSDPMDTWSYLQSRWENEQPTVEFRPVSGFSVEMQIVCALWVNLVGHKFDACLGKSAAGTRLRRLRGSDEGDCSPEFHLEAPGSFKPYFYGYREWRDRGLKAIRGELSLGRKVIVLTMDLVSFYHRVDPKFILNSDFQDSISFKSRNGSLSRFEMMLTNALIDAFRAWVKQIPGENVGLPVGVPAARIFANVLLGEFDSLVQQHLNPIYYGRYVDDVFLVMRDTGFLKTPEDVLEYICKRLSCLKSSEEGLLLTRPYQETSHLVFGREKQRIFLLSGEIGADLIDAIETKIDEVSSEWRLLPDIDDLERTPAARVLTAARQGKDEVDSLRKADQLSLRRLSFALMLRSIDALTRDLPPSEWRAERIRFYTFANTHVITPLRILDLNDYLPRLLGIAVACGDWEDAKCIIRRISMVIGKLEDETHCDQEHKETPRKTTFPRIKPPPRGIWNKFRKSLGESLIEFCLRAYPIERGECELFGTVANEIRQLFELGNDEEDDYFHLAKGLFWSDLARRPFKDLLLDDLELTIPTEALEMRHLPQSRLERASDIRGFLNTIGKGAGKQDSFLLPLLFPTRPISVSELTELIPDTASDLQKLRSLIQTLRGTWVKPRTKQDSSERENDDLIKVGCAY